MPSKKKNSGALVPVNPPTRDVSRQMHGGTEFILAEAVYHVPSVHPATEGPWALEADKVAWTDRTTGLGCIIRRSGVTGCLDGFVGIGPEHPLFGAAETALVGLGIRVHGGIDYAAACEKDVPEAVSVCHVVRDAPTVTLRYERPSSAASVHDDAWWFGFSCDQQTDVIPSPHRNQQATPELEGVNDRVYRDEAFVYRECVHLAAQLTAIAKGLDPMEVSPEQPAVPFFDLNRTKG